MLTEGTVKKNKLQLRRTVVGVVVSDKMTKTIVVRVSRKVKHPFYKKFVLKSVQYQAHDEKQEAKIGDLVSLVESRPLSRHKRWVLRAITRKAGLSSVEIVDSNVVSGI